MLKFKTTCESCRFVIKNNNVQTGCQVGFAEAFDKSDGNIIKGDSWLMDIVCPYHNNEHDPEVSFEDLKLRTVPRVNFIVFYDSNISDLITTINSIMDNQYFNEKGHITLVYDTKNTQELFDVLGIAYKLDKFTFVSIMDNDIVWMDEAFRNVKNGYVISVKSGFQVPMGIINVLRWSITYGMKKIAYIKGVDEQQNLRTVMSIFGKYLQLDKVVDIETKINSILQEQNITSKMTFTWEELNDSYHLQLA